MIERSNRQKEKLTRLTLIGNFKLTDMSVIQYVENGCTKKPLIVLHSVLDFTKSQHHRALCHRRLHHLDNTFDPCGSSGD